MPIHEQGESRPDLIRDACREIRAEMAESSHGRYPHPTKAEQVLQLLEDRPDHRISFEEILPLFADTKKPEYAAWMVLRRLHYKLLDEGLSLVRPNDYYILPVEEK